MAEMAEYQNNLYPPLQEKQKMLFKSLLNGKHVPLCSVLTRFEIEKETAAIRHALQAADLSCGGCNGNHRCFTVAGGFPSYLVGNTRSYGDIDIFINCDGALENVLLEGSVLCVSNNNVANMYYNGYRLQIIQVNFNVDVPVVEMESAHFIDLFSLYILSTFDMPICKVALKFIGDVTTVINVSGSPPSYCHGTVNRARIQKYARRIKPNHTYTVPTLQQLVMLKVLSMHNCNRSVNSNH